MFAVTFYGYIKPEKLPAAQEMGRQMYAAVVNAPGFIELQRAMVDEYTELSIVYFDTEENIRRWYNDPNHQRVMKISRAEVFRDYRIEVCEIRRSYTMNTSTFGKASEAICPIPASGIECDLSPTSARPKKKNAEHGNPPHSRRKTNACVQQSKGKS